MTTGTNTLRRLRFAEISNPDEDWERVKAYLPDNYQVTRIAVEVPDGEVMIRLLIIGTDVAGWTMDEYVIPRLASGLIFATEISS